MRARRISVFFSLAAVFAAAVAAPQAEQLTLDRCAERVRDKPDAGGGYRCYWAVSRRGQQDAAARALEALLSIEPGQPMALYYLAHIERDRGNERALELYRESAFAYADRENLRGQASVLLVLANELRTRNRLDEAGRTLDQALDVARATRDRGLLASAQCTQARFLQVRGDYGAALRLLYEAEELAFPGGSQLLKMKVLSDLAQTYVKLERFPEALESCRRKVALGGVPLVSYEGAYENYRIARLSAAVGLQSGEMSHEEFVRSLEDSLEIAVQAGHRALEATIRRALGRQLVGPRAIEELKLSLEISRSRGDEERVRAAQRSLALALFQDSPAQRDEAMSVMGGAIDSARAGGDPAETATSLLAKTELLSLVDEREDWLVAAREAIDAVETLLDRQPESSVRARTLHRKAHAYLRLSGLLFASLVASPDPDGDLDLAFRTTEAMRGRVLIEELEVAGIDSVAAREASSQHLLSEVSGEIARIQRKLADPELEGDPREERLAELIRAEQKESALRDRLARSQQGETPPRRKPVPSLEEIRRALAPDQAVLSFQLSHRRRLPVLRTDNGGSWLLLITRDDVAAFSLEDEGLLNKRIRMFLGLCRRGDGAEAEAASLLYRELLGEALQEAGPAIRRLIIVPYGGLHQLPFAALRPEPEGEPLGALYQIVQVPSLTLWLGWRHSAGATLPAALALADPELLAAGEGESLRSADPWVEGLRLGPLPRARAEAEELTRRIGGASRMLAGAEATEHFLKQSDLSDYGILHLATHAVVDYERPVRSAILLSPGAEHEDGFLQAREIAELDLGGKVVILSSCRSASGQVIRGEGVFGLARAFFRAGSRAVIGNLWPMRDEDAEAFVGELSRRIAAGDSLAAAVQAARGERIAAGAPTAAWAGVVLLGDGDFAPMAGGSVFPGWVVRVLLPAAAILAGILIWRRRRPHPIAGASARTE